MSPATATRPRKVRHVASVGDPVLLITGASSGIGAATARRAAEAGYRLVLGARSKEKLEALASELGGAERAIAVPADVMRWEENEALVAAALDTFGRLDVAFANAGFGAKRGWLEETPEHWHDMVLTNVLGAAYTVRAAIPALRETRGHVLLTGRSPEGRPSPAASTRPPSGRSPRWPSRSAAT